MTDLLPGWDDTDLEHIDTGCADETAAAPLAAFSLAGVGAEYGPPAMYGIYPVVDAAIPSMEVSGIVGNGAHSYGYHRSRAALLRAGRTGDYSILLTADKLGDPNACTGIDMKFSPADMRIVTRRLMVAIQADDPRAEPIREVFGTLDGQVVTGYSRQKASTGKPGYVTADTSHLWHVHTSILREYAADRILMLGVAQLAIGAPLVTPPDTQLPIVSLAAVRAAAKCDPARPQGGTTPGSEDDVRLVEAALAKLGLLPAAYAGDGAYGTATIAAYAGWQRKLGYSGRDADGIPGKTSLAKLGAQFAFTVTT